MSNNSVKTQLAELIERAEYHMSRDLFVSVLNDLMCMQSLVEQIKEDPILFCEHCGTSLNRTCPHCS